MANIFIQLSVVLLVVLGVSLLMRLLRQPLIIGYIISGILVGPAMFNLLPHNETITTFSEFGIAFLLFIVGLYLSPKVIKEVGKISLITALGQVVFTSIVGYFVGIWLGFNSITSIYIAIALTFSSTIIITKLLSDKESLETLHGKISVGFLLVQDLIAIIALITISAFSQEGNPAALILITLVKGFVLLAILFLFSYLVLPKLSNFFAKSQEFLFVFAISWGLSLAALFSYAGLSIEVGALIAGVLLSISPYNYEISSKLRPLRDFFIILFFILLGSQIIFSEISKLIMPAIIFSLFVLIGNPLIMMILMGIFGYTKKTGFMMGLIVAQISEFSLILIAAGVKLGHLPNEILSFVTLIGLVTIAGSTYMIMNAEKLYLPMSRFLNIFERKNVKEKKAKKREYEYILLGENRVGFSIMKSFMKLKKKYLVIDFNPERVKNLVRKGIPCVYGDASNIEFIEELKIEKAKLIVSTIPEKEVNLLLLNKIRAKNKNVVIIVTAKRISDTLDLYKAKADYVILPHFIGGEYTAKLIENSGEKKKLYESERLKQIKEIKEILKDWKDISNGEEK